MFYTYTLPADSAGATSYSLVLGAASAASAAMTIRTAAQPLLLNAVTTQFVGVLPPNPWSSDFSSDFGGGPAYILLTVGKLMGAASTETATTVRLKSVPTGAAALQVASTQSASSVQTYLATWVAAAVSASVAALSFPRLFQTILAAKTPQVARQGRGFARILGLITPSNSFSSEFSSEFGVGPGGFATSLMLTVGHVLGVTSPSTQASGLVRSAAKVLAATQAQIAVLLRGKGLQLQTTSPSVQTRTVQPAKVVSATSPESAAVIRRQPVRVSAVSGQSPRLSFGGGNFFARVLGATSAQALGLVRGLAALHGAASPSQVADVRTTGKVLGLVTPSNSFSQEFTSEFGVGPGGVATSLQINVGTKRGVQSPSVTFASRVIGIPRRVASSSVAALSTAGAHLLAVLHVAQAQVVSVTTQLAHAKSLAVGAAQASAVHISSVLSYLRGLGAVSTQASNLARGISHTATGVTSASVQACVRTTGRLLSAVSASAASLSAIAAHFLAIHASSAQIVLERSSRTLVRGATSAQSAHLSLSGRVVTLALGAASSAAASVFRLTNKLIGVASTQVAIVGRINFKIIHATMTNVAHMIRPRGLALSASQGQHSRLVSWFLFFIPDWAYQQTVYFPPPGGPPEPPVFGPIDPSDETIMGFDWSKRANANDPLISATVVSVPSGLQFAGPVFIQGTIVRFTLAPYAPLQIPTVYRLRCTAVFASGRRSSFSIPVFVEAL